MENGGRGGGAKQIRRRGYWSLYFEMKPSPTHTHTHARTHARAHTRTHTHSRTHSRTHARTHTRKQTGTGRLWIQRNFRKQPHKASALTRNSLLQTLVVSIVAELLQQQRVELLQHFELLQFAVDDVQVLCRSFTWSARKQCVLNQHKSRLLEIIQLQFSMSVYYY